MIEERIFNNRYRLDRKLGEGGMATVFCGTDTLLRRRVAIKVLREQYAADDEFVRRFYQEAESAAKLSHPNIVNTFDVGRQDDTYYIVMELVDGPSLAEIIAADGRLPEPVAIDYAAQIASGLAYAHRQGLLHRDIKPANILVTKDDVVKLSDFGIARAVSQQTMALTKPGLVMGSVYYISPEQAQEHEVHETSDLYSLGIVLYQMLTGSLPFTGESPVTVALKHIGDPVPVIDTHTTEVSPALAAIVNRLLQKNPERRFQSASELATALREARERPSIPSYRIADDAPGRRPPSRGSLPPRRSPMPDRRELEELEVPASGRRAWIAAALLLALIGATAVGYFLFGRPLPALAPGITVDDYTGMTQAQAQEAVVNAGLRTRFTKTASETVAADHVIRQQPAAGTKVEKNQVVELFISNGKPLLGLDDVRGFSVNDAQRTLQQHGFAVTLARRFDNTIRDNVIDQRPKPGAKVPEGSRVTLVVSDGPAPILIPSFVGMTLEKAQARANSLGITLDSTQHIVGNPPDTIASQSIAAGSKVDKNAILHVVVNSGLPANAATPAAQGPMADVPTVMGLQYNDAVQTLTQAGFHPTVQYAQQSTGNGTIVSQDPSGGQAAQGGDITITLSVSGQVPDTDGMTPAKAYDTLSAFGYQVSKREYTTSVGADGKVVGTTPPVGTPLAPGSSVTITINGTPPP
ncbi:MAG TPA: Stk1 family PASTA domain-containing Ser/Thr kinase [Candidatus Cybelea sp.]|nr:Stk1 family PASTA domain-containing Ser/Thr kinase [Candidatus Cybelea sp.]